MEKLLVQLHFYRYAELCESLTANVNSVLTLAGKDKVFVSIFMFEMPL